MGIRSILSILDRLMMRMMHIKESGVLLSIALLLLVQNYAYSQHVVKTNDELIALLVEDKDQGVILLDGELFQMGGMVVKAGGT